MTRTQARSDSQTASSVLASAPVDGDFALPQAVAAADSAKREAEAEAAGRRQGLSLCHNGPQLPNPTYAWKELEGSTIGFRGQEAVELAAAFWPDIEPPRITQKPYRNIDPITDTDAIDRALIIAPGMVQIRVSDPRTKDPTNMGQQAKHDDEQLTINGYLDDLNRFDPDEAGTEGIVTEFSAGSKRRLGRTIASIDWPSVILRDHRLALITLTMPGDWERSCPTPDVFYTLLRKFDKRYKRATGNPLSTVWKREFQRRGAPHYHLLAPLPLTIGNECVKDWISRNWYEVVGSGDPRHLAAGTGVDWSEGMRMSDANRAAAYFCGYSAGKADGKAYQDQAPDHWRNHNGSVGRWWGTLGLETTTAQRRVTDRQIVETKRLLRRSLAAQKRLRQVSTRRVDRQTGEVTYRRSNRRYRLSSLSGGTRTGCTYLTNDGPALAVALARALHPDTTWPPGQRRPLP